MSVAIDLSTITPGFADPVRQSQGSFRAVLDAMSHPGTIVALDASDKAGGFGAMGAIALTLLDYETPVWLGDRQGADDFANWLRFHCGCPVVGNAAEAAFAFLPADGLPDLSAFNQGDAKYPDQAATVVIHCPALQGGEPVVLEGPGIKARATIAPQGLDQGFWAQVTANRNQFQLGVDIILAADDAIIGLPRTTRIIREG